MKAAVLWGGLALAGCGATGYHPNNLRGGYSEIRLNARAYRVTFEGNGHTPAETAKLYALRRAAELALENGFPAFCLAASDDSATYSTHTMPTNCFRNAYGYTTCTGGQSKLVASPTSDVTVQLLTRDEKDSCPIANLVEAEPFLGQFNEQ